MTTGRVMDRQRDAGVIVWHAGAGDVEYDRVEVAAVAFDSAIACRSEPGPLSFVFVTAMLRPVGVTVVVSSAVLFRRRRSALPDATLALSVSVAAARVVHVDLEVERFGRLQAGTAHVTC